MLLSYIKLFSCALGNKWDLTDRHSHVKGEDAEMCCGLCRHDIRVCVCVSGGEEVGLCTLCSDLVEPKQAPWLGMFACLFLWDRLVLASQSYLRSQSAFGLFKASLQIPSSHLEIGPCVFSVSSCHCECSQQLEPRQGFLRGASFAALSCRDDGGWF